MFHSVNRRGRLGGLWIVALVLASILILVLAQMNLTPGHFGFADTDGCTCGVSYTTYPSDPACEPARSMHCEHLLWPDRLLVYLSYLDFNK